MGALSAGPPAIICNAVPLHTAINGQFLTRSGLVCVSGQQGMSSGMSVDPYSTDVASTPIAAAIDAAGTVIGASTIPRDARAARKRQMVRRRVTAQSYHRMAKSGRNSGNGFCLCGMRPRAFPVRGMAGGGRPVPEP